jgi:predicted ABC-type ATPase
VRRRFVLSVRNLFELSIPVADQWQVLDKSGASGAIKVAESKRSLKVAARKKWQNLQELAASAWPP